MDDAADTFTLAALRRCARTLSDDADAIARLLADVRERLDSGAAAMEASGSLHAARTLAGAYWSLAHVGRALPWLRTEVLLLAAALPASVCGRSAPLPAGHPWLDLSTDSPLRLDEDLLDVIVG